MVSIVASRQLTNNFVICISSHSLGPRLPVAWDTCQLEDFKFVDLSTFLPTYSTFGTHIPFCFAVSFVLFVCSRTVFNAPAGIPTINPLVSKDFLLPKFSISTIWHWALNQQLRFSLVKFVVCKILEDHPPLETTLRGQASSQNLLTLLGFRTFWKKLCSITFITDSNPHSLCFPFIAVNCYRKIGWQISLSVSLDHRYRLVSPQILP